MNRKKVMLLLCVALIAMLPLRTVWALAVDTISIDASGSLGFTLSNDDGVPYDGIIIETPFTGTDQFQLGGSLPAGWTQSFDLASGIVRSLYIAAPGPSIDPGQTQSFPVLFDSTLIPNISDFLRSNGGTFTITAFTFSGSDFNQTYNLDLATVPLPMSWTLLMSGLGILILLAGKRPRAREATASIT